MSQQILYVKRVGGWRALRGPMLLAEHTSAFSKQVFREAILVVGMHLARGRVLGWSPMMLAETHVPLRFIRQPLHIITNIFRATLPRVKGAKWLFELGVLMGRSS